ncbi:hypothetical protein ACWCPF_43415 [Streptomyces sp. NPDC001858]
MTSEHDMLWSRCTHLGRVLLPLVDQEPWRQARRHDNLRAWGIDIAEGEQLIEVFAALATHAVSVAASVPAAALDALPLATVVEAATSLRGIELLAGLPDASTAGPDGQAVGLFRTYTYEGGQTSRWLFQLSREVRHALITLAERQPIPSFTCGDVFRQATEAGLLP